jgi:hypothetical protein
MPLWFKKETWGGSKSKPKGKSKAKGKKKTVKKPNKQQGGVLPLLMSSLIPKNPTAQLFSSLF